MLSGTGEVAAWGSSPLTRGKLRHLLAQARRGRLIPAHAGKTASLRLEVRTGGAHPRSRGENLQCLPEGKQQVGSSPLTRGKRPRHPRPRAGLRLIPAHAGKTFPPSRATTSAPAHPRSRGENDWNPRGVAVSHGSSPLTRGKLKEVVSIWKIPGLIPAHAGKTMFAISVSGVHGAHPRSRGENVSIFLDRRGQLGSSPLTRGKPHEGPVLVG